MTPPEMTSEATQPPRKSGMSGGAKLLIALGVGAGILVLLCCGGLIGVGVYFASGASDDPTAIAAKTNEITRIEIPEGLDPRMSFDMKIPFADQRMIWAVYKDEETDSALVLFAFGGGSVPEDPEEMRRQMDQSLRQQGMGDQEDMVVERSYQKDVEIRGETASFTIDQGVGNESKTPRIRVTGVFQGESGPVMLIFNADAEEYSEDDIVQMLESIQ